MNKKTVLILILLLSVIVRLYGITNENIWLDEAISIRFADRSLSDTIYANSNENTPPLFDLLLNLWMRLFGHSAISVRLLSLIIGTISVFMIYKLGKLLYSENIGLISAFILSISSFNIYYSQEARSYSLLALMSILSIYYYLKMDKEPKKYVIFYLISSVLMLYTHVFGVFVIIVENIDFLINFLKNRDFKKLIKWIIIQISILILFMPWILVIVSRMENFKTVTGKWIERPTFFGPSQQALLYTFNDFAGNFSLFIIYLFIFVYSIKNFKNEKNYILYIWLFFPILFCFIFSRYLTPIYVTRYFISSSIALYILLSFSLGKIKYTVIKYGFIFLIFFFSIIAIINQSNIYNKDRWGEVVDYVKNTMTEEESIILTAPYMVSPFLYFYDYNCLIADEGSYVCAPTIDIYPLNFDYQLENVNNLEKSIWLITSQSKLADINESISKYFKENRELLDYKKYPLDIEVFHFSSLN